MLYAIRHVTKYHYDQDIQENVMEVRKHPISNDRQRCLTFSLSMDPEVRVFRYQDHLGNVVHHFDVPWAHHEVQIVGESVVEVRKPESNGNLSWDQLAKKVESHDFYDMLEPTALVDMATGFEGIDFKDFETPHDLAVALCKMVRAQFAYEKASTQVDSSSTLVMRQKRGVSQDFAHVMLSVLRQARIPCRYISGYRFSPEAAEVDTSHAWVEAFVSESGWRGYDPSRGVVTDETYITNCVGRDYADCPPTRGVFRGNAQSTLRYAVHVRPAEIPAREDQFVRF
ncbi:MAG: transglutaminase family protein [Candidatus Eremiobacteraeota bacterium]|nr:transglutaminase family protein [Candidatus Eremiobacteraeota bacterium]